MSVQLDSKKDLGLPPRQIVAELDKYIVGQKSAKKSVAIALRNRFRREQLDKEMIDEVMPKNILMIGPTGVGKTEIARRLAKLADSPFIKVEATKFTEVGYIGRDVESIVRDLVEMAVRMIKNEQLNEVSEKARARAEERIAEVLAGEVKSKRNPMEAMGALFPMFSMDEDEEQEEKESAEEELPKSKKEWLQELREGLHGELSIEMELQETHAQEVQVFGGAGMEEMGMNFQEILSGMMPKKMSKQKLLVKEALPIVTYEESQKLIDVERVKREATRRVEQKGIVFLDEIDKVATGSGSGRSGPDVSREGVQRDLLPIVEGSTVNTKYGPVKTDHILFIASGAFHVSKPSDLIPELQGRFPIRVELESLTAKDFERILVEPKNSLTKQYSALMGSEGLDLTFSQDAICEIARIAQEVNESSENIGARRLNTILEKVLEEISFEADELEEKEIEIGREYVVERLSDILKKQDLANYIL